MHTSRRNKSSRSHAKLKAKKEKERMRKTGRLAKRRAGGRLSKRLKREPYARCSSDSLQSNKSTPRALLGIEQRLNPHNPERG